MPMVDTKTRKPLYISGFAFGAERGIRTLYNVSKNLGIIAFYSICDAFHGAFTVEFEKYSFAFCMKSTLALCMICP